MSQMFSSHKKFYTTPLKILESMVILTMFNPMKLLYLGGSTRNLIICVAGPTGMSLYRSQVSIAINVRMIPTPVSLFPGVLSARYPLTFSLAIKEQRLDNSGRKDRRNTKEILGYLDKIKSSMFWDLIIIWLLNCNMN